MLQINKSICIVETIIPKNRDNFVVLRFESRRKRHNGFWFTDCWGKIYCFGQANDYMRKKIRDNPKLLDKNYNVYLADMKIELRKNQKSQRYELHVFTNEIFNSEDYKRQEQERIVIPKCNINDESYMTIADMPSFDFDTDMKF